MASLEQEVTIKIRRDTAGNWTSNNPTPNAGEWCLENDTGAYKLGDGSTAWTSLEYRQRLPYTHDLTSANVTHTLPAITGYPQKESIYWTNGGTYKLSLAVTDAATVGGLTATTWEGEGEGHMVVESDGTNWQVREYEDSGEIADTGLNINRFWNKYKDGTYIAKGQFSTTTSPITIAFGTIYRSAIVIATFGVTFTNVPKVIATVATSDQYTWPTVNASTTTTTSINFLDAVSQASATVKVNWSATGRWRA